MDTVAPDIGTTAAKAAAFREGRRVGEILGCTVSLQLNGEAAELQAEAVVQLTLDLVRQAGRLLEGRVDWIALATMHPAICLLDAADRPITPVLCHLDRRSEPQALQIAEHFGERQLLEVGGNLPIPGGIASTMAAVGAALDWVHRTFFAELDEPLPGDDTATGCLVAGADAAGGGKDIGRKRAAASGCRARSDGGALGYRHVTG